MTTKQEILDQIAEKISSNGLQKINGVILNTILTAIAEIIPEETMLTSSFGGIIKASDTIITTPGSSKWFIAKGGVYANYGGFTLLDKNFNILSYNGTIWDKSEIEIPNFSISETFDKTSSTKGQGGKQIAEFFGIEEKVIPTVLGTSLVGTNTSPMGGADGSFISNSLNKTSKDLIIKNVVTNFSTGGTFKVAITSSSNTVIYTSQEYTAAAGSQTTVLADLQLKKDQTIWLVTSMSTTAVIKWGQNNTSGGNFLQRSSSGNVVTGPSNSYYSVFFNGEEHKNDGVLSKYVKKADADGVEIIDPLESFGSVVRNTSIGNQPVVSYYILKVPFTTTKVLQEINFYSGAAGNVNFVIGFIEQSGRFVESKTFVKSVVVGLNNIAIDNEELKVGDYLAIKTPGIMPDVNTAIANNYLYHTEGSYTKEVAPGVSYSLALSIKVKTIINKPDAFARKSQLAALEEKINNFQASDIKIDANGVKWKMSVSTSGTTIWTAVGKYTKILHLGNSMLKHGITSDWWGEWGMAASKRENDYAHQFLAKIKVSNPTAVSWEENIADWELNPGTYNKANFDSFLLANPYDLIIIRLGENVTYYNNFKNDYKALVAYVQNKVPTARIIIGGLFWAHAAKDAAIKAAALELNLTYVSMEGVDTPSTRSSIGAIVQGDDGQSHTVKNDGVAAHPNDQGMGHMGTRLFNAVTS